MPQRPEGTDVVFPHVRCIEDAHREHVRFHHAVSVGPAAHDVRFRVARHLLVEFDDVDLDPDSPEAVRRGLRPATGADVERIIAFGRALPDRAEVLVHCHMGVSRSTATALILNLSRGVGLGTSWDLLVRHHPDPGTIDPNRRLIRLAQESLNLSPLEPRLRELQR